MAQDAHVCPLCLGMHAADDGRCAFEFPAFDHICHGFQHLLDDSHWAMHLFMRHPYQKEVASSLLQLLDRIDETLT